MMPIDNTTCNLWVVKRLCVEFWGVFGSPVAKILLYHCARKVKMGFIATPQNARGRHCCDGNIAALYTPYPVCWRQFLTNHNLLGI